MLNTEVHEDAAHVLSGEIEWQRVSRDEMRWLLVESGLDPMGQINRVT